MESSYIISDVIPIFYNIENNDAGVIAKIKERALPDTKLSKTKFLDFIITRKTTNRSDSYWFCKQLLAFKIISQEGKIVTINWARLEMFKREYERQ